MSRRRHGNYDWDRMRDDGPDEGGCMRLGALLAGAIAIAFLGASAAYFGTLSISALGSSMNYGGALENKERKGYGKWRKKFAYQEDFFANFAGLMITFGGVWAWAKSQQKLMGFGFEELRLEAGIGAVLAAIIFFVLLL